MKSLYLIRHAKSSWKDLSLDDFDRPLNSRGKKAAPFMGRQLKQRNELIQIILSSPAKRAITTARIIGKEIGYSGTIIAKQEIYHARPRDLFGVVNDISDEYASAALFGHNPGFTDFLNSLTNAGIYNMPTAGIARIDFEFDLWQMISAETGTLTWFDYPKRHPELSDLGQ